MVVRAVLVSIPMRSLLVTTADLLCSHVKGPLCGSWDLEIRSLKDQETMQ
jgi:hypothetical protein